MRWRLNFVNAVIPTRLRRNLIGSGHQPSISVIILLILLIFCLTSCKKERIDHWRSMIWGGSRKTPEKSAGKGNAQEKTERGAAVNQLSEREKDDPSEEKKRGKSALPSGE